MFILFNLIVLVIYSLICQVTFASSAYFWRFWSLITKFQNHNWIMSAHLCKPLFFLFIFLLNEDNTIPSRLFTFILVLIDETHDHTLSVSLLLSTQEINRESRKKWLTMSVFSWGIWEEHSAYGKHEAPGYKLPSYPKHFPFSSNIKHM